MNGMCDTKGWDAQGRETPCQSKNDNKDCQVCIDVFEQTQGEVELLRVQLKAALEGVQSPAGDDFRRALMAAMPARRPTCGKPEHAEFHRGWNACLDLMEDHLRDLFTHP